MRSSAPTDEIEAVARALAPGRVEAVTELRHGNNSRVFRVDTAGDRFALKRYPATDNRPRLAAEVAALRYFERHAIERTPRVVAVAPERHAALFTWLEGEKVRTVSDADIAEFAQFQIALDRVRLCSGSTATLAPTRPILSFGLASFNASATLTSLANDGVEVCMTTSS